MHNLAVIAGRNMSHRVVIMSWGVMHLLLYEVGVMHLLLHIVIIVFVIASRGISRIYKSTMLHWFTRNVVTGLASLRRLLDRRDNILQQFILNRFSVDVNVFEVKITNMVSSDRRLRSMAMMIDKLRLINRCVVDHWLVVLNNGVLIHWLVVLHNGVLIHWLVVLNNGMLVHWLVVLNNVLIHWLVVLNRCRNNRGMSNKWLVRDRHMICNTWSSLSGITISRKGNDISWSHMTTYMNFPHAGNETNFLNSHRVRH